MASKPDNDAQLETAFAALLQKRVAALVVASDPFFDSRRKRIISFAAENRLPGIYQFRDYVLMAASSVTAPASSTHIVK